MATVKFYYWPVLYPDIKALNLVIFLTMIQDSSN